MSVALEGVAGVLGTIEHLFHTPPRGRPGEAHAIPIKSAVLLRFTGSPGASRLDLIATRPQPIEGRNPQQVWDEVYGIESRR